MKQTKIIIDPEFRDLIPPLSDDEKAGLEASLLADGCRHPLVIWQGILVDGHHRYAICEEHGIDYTTTTLDVKTRRDARIWSRKNAMSQRNLSVYARGLLGLGLLEDEEAAAKERKAEAGRSAAPGRPAKKDEATLPHVTQAQEMVDNTGVFSVPEPERAPQARDRAAAAVGIGARTLDKVKLINAEADEETKEKLRAGETTISREYIKIKREQRANEAKAGGHELTGSGYRVVYADPPWSYGNSGVVDDADAYGRAARHYPSMTIDELCAMPVRDIVEDDAVLFMWVTSPLLAECWPVIKSWGFKYKSSFVWDKVGHNFGHYNSVRHELLLVCTRGSCLPDKKELVDSVQSIQKSRKHSEKPAEFRKLIDNLYTTGKRIELFARSETDGWDAFGNES